MLRAPAATRENPGGSLLQSREAHFLCGVSRVITPKLWNFQRVLHTLATTQEVPRHTRLHSRGSTRVQPPPEELRFLLQTRDEGSFSASSGKNFRRFRRISRGGALHSKGERNSWVVPPFQESPRCLSPLQRILFSLHCFDFHAEDRLTPRWHVGQPCMKASWESLEGKPQIP